MHCNLLRPRGHENVKEKGRENAELTDMDPEKLNNNIASTAPQKLHTSSGKLSRASSDAANEAAEYSAKYRMYERDYLRRINHKYFSGKNLAGTGRVFETVTTVDGFTVKESSCVSTPPRSWAGRKLKLHVVSVLLLDRLEMHKGRSRTEVSLSSEDSKGGSAWVAWVHWIGNHQSRDFWNFQALQRST
ncbi:hypothetical protein AXG93_3256s1820 [Marchantia polymorpha subsp. ruderalis]|uniref:Uncharacterized protein n=1 Tax=Marchantia polymorpha subsp. ruderalis TaxID=1480154 RepID=A0A176VLY4_MARPO|nr:hypothetical protein AXG93_3256s1820 [Marchantia polymorpha subsp. ruderalis]